MKKNTPPHFPLPFDHACLMSFLDSSDLLAEHAGIGYLGESILGRGIPIITLGHGKKELLYVGAHHGMEALTSLLLCRFLWEYVALAEDGGRAYGRDLAQLQERYTVYIIPMLNPDGVEYATHGVGEDNPLYDRLLRMNGDSTDFSRWQANARGVDLNHNYDCEFELHKAWEKENGIEEGAPTRYGGLSPESEPEVAHLCNFIRFHPALCGILTLHTRGEEIFYRAKEDRAAHVTLLAQQISRLCGYRLSKPTGTASHSGMSDWCGGVLGIPAFTLECGKGENPMPQEDWKRVYLHLRELLFKFPFMF